MAEQVDRFLAGVVRGDAPSWPGGWAEARAGEAWDRIRFHGIAFQAAEQAGEDWPASLREQVREEAQQQAFWEESHAVALRRLLAHLHAAGVEALVLKGTALAYSLYRIPAARRRGDTDLLVHPDQVGLARQVLRECGFFPRDNPHGLQSQETWLFDTGIGVVHAVDLHWQPADSPVLRRAVETEGFMAGSQPLPALSEHARMPSFLDTFVQGACNQMWHGKHGYLVDGESVTGDGRLIWALDNILLMQAFSEADWAQLVRSSLDHGFAPISLAALELAQDTFDTPAPEDVLRELRQAPQETVMVKRLQSTNLIECFLADLGALSGLGNKSAFILAHALPPRAHVRAKYPEHASWPLPLLYLRRFAESVARWRRLRAR